MTQSIYSRIFSPKLKPILKWFMILWIASIMLSVPYSDLGFFVFKVPLISIISVLLFEATALTTLIRIFKGKLDQIFFISLFFTFILAFLSGVISSLSIIEISGNVGFYGRLLRNVWYLLPVIYALVKIKYGQLKKRDNLILAMVGLLPVVFYLLKLIMP